MKTKIIFIALAFLAIAMIAGAAANAASAQPFSPELEAGYRAALSWWGESAPPLCDSVTLEVSTDAPDPTAFGDPPGAPVDASATIPREPHTACYFTVYEPAWSALSPCMKEMAERHEVGHLGGYEHSTDPASIMAPRISAEVWCPQDVAAAAAAALQEAKIANFQGQIAHIRVALRKFARRCPHLSIGQPRHECWVGASYWREELVELKEALAALR